MNTYNITKTLLRRAIATMEPGDSFVLAYPAEPANQCPSLLVAVEHRFDGHAFRCVDLIHGNVFYLKSGVVVHPITFHIEVTIQTI